MIDEHVLDVIHADGIAVQPVGWTTVMGMAETYDVAGHPEESGSYTLHAGAQDGSGQAIGALHTPDVRRCRRGPAELADARSLRDLARAPTDAAGGRRTKLSPSLSRRHEAVRLDDRRPGVAERRPADDRPRRAVEIDDNDQTSMWHPMHLHGHFFRVLQGAAPTAPLKHTVTFSPRQTSG